MILSKTTKKELILLDATFETREAALQKLCQLMAKEKVVSDYETYYNAVMERESISETGFDKGIAIPHGKSATVKEAMFAVARLQKPIGDWPSLKEGNNVDLIFLLAIPEDGDASHLKLLSTLSTRLMNEDIVMALKEAKGIDAFLRQLDKDTTVAVSEKEYTQSILVLTACSAGIAHTYMAAEALEKAGEKAGYKVYSEKQGANGIEDEITASQIKAASAVIFATNLPLKNKGRFNGLPFVSTNVSEPLKNAEGLIEKAINNPDGIVKVDSEGSAESANGEVKQTFWGQIYQGISTGISYMIPVIVAAGLMMGIGQLGASFFGLAKSINEVQFGTDPNELIRILHYLSIYGGMIMKFIYPVFGAFMAYSIADRPGIAPGFIAGAFAGGLHYTFWQEGSGIPSGFFGVLILATAVGFIAKYLNKKIKLHKNLQAMKPMFIVPGITVLILFFLNFYIVDPVFGGLNATLQDLITQYKDSGTIILATIIAALTAFDLGGPVNKSAGAIAIGLAADGVFPLTARVLSIVIPPIGIGLATVMDKLVVKRRVFDEAQRVTGTTSLILGFLAIGEGAIPFMLKNPIITISINVLGAIVGSLTAISLGAVQWLPLPAVWGWPLVENIPAYLIGMFVGIMFIALANIFVRFYLIKRQEAK